MDRRRAGVEGERGVLNAIGQHIAAGSSRDGEQGAVLSLARVHQRAVERHRCTLSVRDDGIVVGGTVLATVDDNASPDAGQHGRRW